MKDDKLYEELARHLDQGIVGAPISPSLIQILKILFPADEARIAVKLPMQNITLAELQDLFTDEGESLEEILNRMVRRGTVFTSQSPGQERIFRLLPSVVGWAETPFWAGTDSEARRKLAPLWLKYREEAFGAELARAGMPVVRVLPISKKLRESSEVMPYNALKPLIESQSYCAVAHCPCRQMKTQVGKVVAILWKIACISAPWDATWWSRVWPGRYPSLRRFTY